MLAEQSLKELRHLAQDFEPSSLDPPALNIIKKNLHDRSLTHSLKRASDEPFPLSLSGPNIQSHSHALYASALRGRMDTRSPRAKEPSVDPKVQGVEPETPEDLK